MWEQEIANGDGNEEKGEEREKVISELVNRRHFERLLMSALSHGTFETGPINTAED
jgi:hypothetical protein